jgi:hypothetical protein
MRGRSSLGGIESEDQLQEECRREHKEWKGVADSPLPCEYEER